MSTHPVRSFFSSNNVAACDRDPREDGNLPENRLWSIIRCSNVESEPSNGGSVPVRPFACNTNARSGGSLRNIFRGSGPVKWLPWHRQPLATATIQTHSQQQSKQNDVSSTIHIGISGLHSVIRSIVRTCKFRYESRPNDPNAAGIWINETVQIQRRHS